MASVGAELSAPPSRFLPPVILPIVSFHPARVRSCDALVSHNNERRAFVYGRRTGALSHHVGEYHGRNVDLGVSPDLGILRPVRGNLETGRSRGGRGDVPLTKGVVAPPALAVTPPMAESFAFPNNETDLARPHPWRSLVASSVSHGARCRGSLGHRSNDDQGVAPSVGLTDHYSRTFPGPVRSEFRAFLFRREGVCR